jgi:hypothetical protein
MHPIIASSWLVGHRRREPMHWENELDALTDGAYSGRRKATARGSARRLFVWLRRRAGEPFASQAEESRR